MAKKKGKKAKFLIALDYDLTWSSDPELFAFLGKAIRKAGGKVVVLTGNADAEKDIGSSKSYDDIVVVKKNDPDDPGNDTVAPAKQDWLKDNDADLLIDNDAQNVQLAAAITNAALFFPSTKELLETKSARRELDELRSRYGSSQA